MKTLKNLFYVAITMAFAASCSSEEFETPATSQKDGGLKYMEFTASIGADTRTLLTDDNNVVWVNGDAISIFDGTANRKFTTKDNGPSAVFGGEAKEANVYYALYPYQEGATIQGSLIKNVTIPVVQEAKAGSFESGNNISVASASKDLHLAFKNVGSLVKFSMTNDKAADVRTVKLTSNGGNAMLAGTVNINVGATPTVTAVSGQSQVTLKSDNGFEKNKEYYFMVLPSTLSDGFSLTFTDKDNKTWRKTYTAEANMSRSNILKLNDIELGNFTTDLLSNVNLIAAAEANTGQAFTKNADGTVDLNNVTNRAIVEAVTTLDVSDKNDATIADDLSYFTGLKVLHCGGNNIESLDLSANLALEELHCFGIEHFENYVNDDEHGESLGWDGSLKHIYISSNTALKKLNVMGNQLTGIDLSNNPALTHLWINDNYNLGTLNISNNTALVYLNAGSDNLRELDVTNNTLLEEMWVADNITFSLIGLPNLIYLKVLDINNNGLSSLDVSQNTALIKLYCSWQSIRTLDLSHNPNLEYLHCHYIDVTELDLTHNTKLVNVELWGNPITAIDLSNNPDLEGINVNYCNLSTIDISHNTNLRWISCFFNDLINLDFSHNNNLDGLYCGGNHIETLDISNTNLLFGYGEAMGNQKDDEGNDLVVTVYINPVQNDGKLGHTSNHKWTGFSDDNANVNLVVKSVATHEGYNENNYGG
ncbi:MAG: fimbrillin family protein [Bacteroidaceae bacterium]|nr:fimbrillin family protein [Bacteroidaceae bacterium]